MRFDKYQAAGNDFIIIDGIGKSDGDYKKLARKICDRHFGIGSDGLMICKESSLADIKMLYYNSDGSQGEMCGNGIRSFSKYIYDNKIIDKSEISIETLDGIKYISLNIDHKDSIINIRVDMGYGVFESSQIPLAIKRAEILEEKIEIEGQTYIFSAVRVGVPHVVVFLDDIKKVNVDYIGKKIENHALFPDKTNVNFIEVLDRDNINIYTWERGAGRTLACGTGSCASVLIGNKLKKLNPNVNVNTEGGKLRVELADNFKIYMLGDAVHIARGEFLKEY